MHLTYELHNIPVRTSKMIGIFEHQSCYHTTKQLQYDNHIDDVITQSFLGIPLLDVDGSLGQLSCQNCISETVSQNDELYHSLHIPPNDVGIGKWVNISTTQNYSHFCYATHLKLHGSSSFVPFFVRHFVSVSLRSVARNSTHPCNTLKTPPAFRNPNSYFPKHPKAKEICIQGIRACIIIMYCNKQT